MAEDPLSKKINFLLATILSNRIEEGEVTLSQLSGSDPVDRSHRGHSFPICNNELQRLSLDYTMSIGDG